MTSTPRNSIRINAVNNRKQLDRFIKLPWSIYRDDPHWVPPLLFEQKQRLTKKNPFFRHAQWQAWTAQLNGHIAGRISAQIDQLYQQRHEDRVGYFGMLEAVDDQELFTALLQTAECWLRERGMEKIRGPFNLSINEECGLLAEGFDTPPSIMMGHARPYYMQQLEASGYSVAKTLLAYHMPPDFEATALMRTLADRASRQVTVRKLRRKQLKQELEIMRDIFNDAWSENWGFVPFTEEEFADIGSMLTLLVDDDFVQIAEIDNQPVAMLIFLPNINEVIRDLNGHLLPFGWIKLLWRLKVGYPTTGRVPLMGVRKAYQHTRLGPALAFLLIDTARKGAIRRGIRDVEMSWILEDNAGIRNVLESIGGIAYKRYRIYEKIL